MTVAAENAPLLAQDITARIDRLMAKSSSGKKPGAAVLVVRDGKIIFQKGYGLADLKTGGAIAPDTAFGQTGGNVR